MKKENASKGSEREKVLINIDPIRKLSNRSFLAYFFVVIKCCRSVISNEVVVKLQKISHKI